MKPFLILLLLACLLPLVAEEKGNTSPPVEPEVQLPDSGCAVVTLDDGSKMTICNVDPALRDQLDRAEPYPDTANRCETTDVGCRNQWTTLYI